MYQVSCVLYGHGHRGPGLFLLERLCVQEPPTHNTGAVACYVG